MILKGRGISKGKVEGRILLINSPFSFLGGVNVTNGTLLAPENLKGTSIDGRIMAFPVGKGSTVGSYAILQLKKMKKSPAAIINHRAEPIIATGAVMAGIPMIDCIDISLLRNDDRAIVNGTTGELELPDIDEVNVVSCILKRDNEILILKRSEKVGTFKGYWAGISGFVEKNEVPLETAYKEVLEEVGVSNAKLLKVGPKIWARSGNRIWAIHSYLFEVGDFDVTLDWEHTEYQWVKPHELEKYKTVPGFDMVISALLNRSDRNS
ncbi:MAG: DUF126 domain-containing protein [Methanomassiliicoccales archaeon]